MPRFKRTRAEAGYAANARGMKFEDEIKRTNEIILARRLGKVVHCHAPAKGVSGHVTWSARGPFDWAGMLKPGIGVFFESKQKDFQQVKPPRVFTLNKRNDHQLAALREMVEMGEENCRCFVLFNWRHIDETGAIISVEMRLHPIQTIPERAILRERGVLAPNRNWYQAAMSQEYVDACKVGFLDFATDEEVPI